MTWLLNLFRRTRAEYFADFFITPPITAVLLVVSLTPSFDWLWPVKFAAGVMMWTLYEYVTHRWVLHRLWLFKQMHQMHHDRQRDYIAIHPAMTIAIYALMWVSFGVGSSAVTIGFSTGYIVYSAMHTAFHYATIEPGHWLYPLKLRHAAHHRIDVNYGVSTALWDHVFRTENKLEN